MVRTAAPYSWDPDTGDELDPSIRWWRCPELTLPHVTTVVKERPSLHLPRSHTEADSTRCGDLTSALSLPQSRPSGEQAAASYDGHGHLASLWTVKAAEAKAT